MSALTPKYYWNFNETGGNTATDSVSGVPMTIDRSNSFRAGKLGNGLHFNPVDGARVVNTYQPEIAPPWTAAMWVLREAASNGSTLLSGAKSALKLEQWGSGGLLGLTEFNKGALGPGEDVKLDAQAPLGQWVHVTYVGTATGTSLYINGQYQAKSTISTPLGLEWIGSTQGYIEFASMTLDELKIFNTALTAQEVSELHANNEPILYVSEGGAAIANRANVAMGSATVGTQGMTKTFTITNTGNANLHLASVRLDNRNDYMIAPEAIAQDLKKGDAVSFTVTFTPKSTAPAGATISISSNDPKQGAYTFQLSGSATAAGKPHIEVTENGKLVVLGGTIDFGNQAVGAKVTKEFVINNRGNDTLLVEAIRLAIANPAFSVSAPGGQQKILPGQSAKFQVTFTATGNQSATADIVISNNDANYSPLTLHVSGRSTGTARLSVGQLTPASTAANASAVNIVPIRNGQTGVHSLMEGRENGVGIVLCNDGNANLVLDNFTTSISGIQLDSDIGNLAGGGKTVVVYPGKDAGMGVFPDIVGTQARLNGLVISFRTNDPGNPQFSLTLQGFKNQ
jgi:hypothetical protein